MLGTVRWILAFQLMFFVIATQAQQISFVKNEVPLLRFFKEIRKQTGASVVWNEKEFNVNRKINANYRNATLKVVMDDLSQQISISYSVIGKMIVVKDRPVFRAPAVAKLDTSLMMSRPPVTLQQVDIVSTGYQLIPKERAAGSFVLVDSVQIDRRVSKDIFSRLEGITSGLMFNRNTVSSNSGNLDMSIRGRSTIYANDQPLIVLDNFPYNGNLESINPNDVGSVTLLKDAAAASIWGVRAGNGVIVVTTKKGKYKQPLSVSMNTNLTLAGKPDVFYNPNYLNSSDFIFIEKFLFDNGKYNALLEDKLNFPVISPVVRILERQKKGELSSADAERQLADLRNNDIRREELKYFYRMPISQQYALSLNGGTSKSNHYFSTGYDETHTALVHNDDSRLTINSQNSFRPFKNLELRAGVYYVGSTARVDSTIRSTSGVSFVPYYEFKDGAGRPTVFNRDVDAVYKASTNHQGFLNWGYVPLDELGSYPMRSEEDDLRMNAGFTYLILNGLSADVRYQYRSIKRAGQRVYDSDSYFVRNMVNKFATVASGPVTGYNVPIGEIADKTADKEVSHNARIQLGYQKSWAKHMVSSIAGYELSEYDSRLNRRVYYGYDPVSAESKDIDSLTTFRINPAGFSKIPTGSQFFGVVDRIRSIYANASYTYDYKYTVTGSARIDGSNYFGVNTNQKNVPLWSAGALWHLDREDFFDLGWLSAIKLRASYGYNGNLDKRYTGITTFRRNQLGAAFTNLPFGSIINIGNPELRWEKIAIANFGLDFAIRGNVLAGKLEYYFKRGTDILGDKAFPANAGIKVLRGNFAELSGQGFDVSLTSQNLAGKVKWQTGVFSSVISDRVKSYDIVEPNSLYYVGNFNDVPVQGKPIYGIYSYRWAGLDPANGDPQGYLNGEVSKDYPAIIENNSIENLQYHGTSRPTLFGSINNIFSYGKFTLGFNINYKLGYYFRKASVNYYQMYNVAVNWSMNRDFEHRWQQTGDEANSNVPSMANNSDDSTRDKFYNSSAATVDKGDHIRLQDVSLSYDVELLNLKRLHIRQLQLYCYANNLGLLWKANNFGLDPDTVPGENERFAAPLSRSLSLGLKVSF